MQPSHIQTTDGVKSVGHDQNVTLYDFTLYCFNCYGFKSSSLYIGEMAKDSDIVCLSELWLYPQEKHLITDVLFKSTGKRDYMVYFKSAMNGCSNLAGRPFSGLAVLVKNQQIILVKRWSLILVAFCM